METGSNAALLDFPMLENFVKKLNSKPPSSAMKQKDGVNYLPISYYEMTLDSLYFGMWKTTNESTNIIANEIIVRLELHVFHPIAKVWITRVGVGASMIQQARGADVTDINSKYKNTMGKDYPSAKSEAVKNAAKSLGKIFGRDISRKKEAVHDYNPMVNASKLKEIAEERQSMLAIIEQNKKLNVNGQGKKEA